MKQIVTSRAPKALGPYSQAIVSGNFCFVSMQLGINPETGSIVSQDITQQTHQAIKNIENILTEANFSLSDIIKVTLYITDLGNFTKVNDTYSDYFTHKPARSLVIQAAMPANAKIALDVIAYKTENSSEETDYVQR